MCFGLMRFYLSQPLSHFECSEPQSFELMLMLSCSWLWEVIMLMAFSCLLISSCLLLTDHRTAGLGGKPSCPSPVAGSPRASCPGCVQPGFDGLHTWRLHILPGQPVPVFEHPHSKNHLCSAEISCVALCSTHLLASQWTQLR